MTIVSLPWPGDVIAQRYELIAQLAQGGIGVVFRAVDKQQGDREVAIKLLLPPYGQRPESRARFKREARVAARLDHHNAVKVHDFGEDGGMLFLVMEFLHGKSLWEHMSQAHELMPTVQVLRIGHQIADVLDSAHQIALVHRDLKPENIFVELTPGAERVVVLDFGLAFIAHTDESSIGRLTKERLIGGTPEYFSPEQARDAEIGPAADVYSLACLLFELFTGTTPFQGNIPDLVTSHLFEPPPLLRDHRPDIPQALSELIASMLNKQPDDRPTAADVRTALAALLADYEA